MIGLARRLLRRRRPRLPTHAEHLAAFQAADLRPARAVTADLGTVRLEAQPRYGNPTAEQPGQNRWAHPWAAFPWVKVGPNRWIYTGGVAAALTDRDVAGYLPGRAGQTTLGGLPAAQPWQPR